MAIKEGIARQASKENINPAARIPATGNAATGSREQQLIKRLNEIQNADPWQSDTKLTQERKALMRELEALSR